MTDNKCSPGTEGPFAWRCCDERYPYLKGLVTERQATVDAWREGDIKFQPLYAIPDPAQTTAVRCPECGFAAQARILCKGCSSVSSTSREGK